MSVVAAHTVSPRSPFQASTTSHLPHWSEVSTDRSRERPSPIVAPILRDLVSWGADIAIVLTRGCPEDRDAIDRVRRYAHAWLAGESCPDVSIEDVLTTAAALMAGIDRDLGGTTFDEDERHATDAAVAA
jgi:hypothetical protein